MDVPKKNDEPHREMDGPSHIGEKDRAYLPELRKIPQKAWL
jgi:hypothetical protein